MGEKRKMEREEIWESIDRLKLFLDIGIYLFLSHLACRSSISGKKSKEQAREELCSGIGIPSLCAFFLASYSYHA